MNNLKSLFATTALLGLFIWNAKAQNSVPRDTSFNVRSTYQKEKKYRPYIQVASVDVDDDIRQSENLVYKTIGQRQLLADIYFPKAAGNHPGILLIFGGGWRSGSKENVRTMAKAFAANGYVAMAAEYRLSLEAQYPKAVYDLKDAVKYMRKNANAFGLDESKVAVLGNSAGGQLAALLGTTNKDKHFESKEDRKLRGQSAEVQAIIDVDGTLAFHHPESVEGKAAAWWLGGTYEENPKNWEEAAPLNHVGKNTPPILFLNSALPRFHAGRDDMIKKLDALKIYHETHTFEDTPHPFWFFHPWFNPMMETAVSFLDKIFEQKRTEAVIIGSGDEERQAMAGKLAEDMAKTIMHKWPDSLVHEPGKAAKWSYDLGVFFEGMSHIYQRTREERYVKYMQHIMDLFVQPDGEIERYNLESYNIDYVKNGSTLLFLYQQTKQEKYKRAATHLREQLKTHPRTSEGGFWHKKVYPHQMWLDGIYMGQPFYAKWSAMFNEPENFDDIAKQFILLNKHARDPQTGLLYHGWDESKEQRWANTETGTSANFWGRAMGWYGMALVDVLDDFPKEHPQRKDLLKILNDFADAITKVQSEKGLWYQVLDKQHQRGNYPEASASNMFVYTLAKGVRNGWLPTRFQAVAKKGFDGISAEFLEKDKDGFLHLNGTVQVSGLGGKPYRSGSYEYYLSEPVIKDDAKGMGAFILAANEIALLSGRSNVESKK